ncbi:MAG TPA: hydantoinase B/oxoprolinase family protein [Candidatus Sulfotelmatobacter sp.]|nr:hydantoinase B/oxoprolinase family protein [Candidatus Sulfotelmatobacter sp.]
MTQLDPITLEIVHNGLRSITDEAFIALMKSAYSTNIKERRDHSATIMTPKGELVAQAEGSLPIHLASMLGLMQALLAKHALDDMRVGDIFIANDPHVAGGTHLPDVNMAMPVFVDGRVIGFVCNIAHHADIGGMAPGSMAGGMSEIYQEGVRIPVIRLFDGGRLASDVLDLLLLNVRVPEERRGDYFAQVAACRLAERRLIELAAAHGAATLTQSFDAIIARTERRLRDAIRTIPSGRYSFADVMDDDGLGTTDIRIEVAITVDGERIHFDFAGSHAQVAGNINLTLIGTRAAACYCIKALLDPDVPNNQGVLNAIEVTAPEGSVVNAKFPAAVASRAHTCQRIADVVIGALAPALPQAAVGAANGANTTAVFSGVDPRSGRAYVYLETLGGGFGGRATKDGKDGVQVHITNTSNLPVEAIEMEYPLLVEAYGLVEDSGGTGTWRGGLGLRRVVRPLDHHAVFSGTGERFRTQPWGVFGGGPGASGRFMRQSANGDPERLGNKPADVTVRPDQTIVMETPGAGGYGPPAARDPERLAEDRRSGKFSTAYLAAHYGAKPS